MQLKDFELHSMNATAFNLRMHNVYATLDIK